MVLLVYCNVNYLITVLYSRVEKDLLCYTTAVQYCTGYYSAVLCTTALQFVCLHSGILEFDRNNRSL